jgi:hypothetical protein
MKTARHLLQRHVSNTHKTDQSWRRETKQNTNNRNNADRGRDQQEAEYSCFFS